MGWIRALLWLVVIAILLGFAWLVAPRLEFTGRLLNLFVHATPWLPSWLTFEQFLVAAMLACLTLTAGVLSVVLVSGLAFQASSMLARRKQQLREVEIQRRADELATRAKEDYQRLTTLGMSLTQRLERRAIAQNMLQAASQVTSQPRSDSAVGLWVLDFETECMRFEAGSRCDESTFVKREFSVVEPPFAKLISSRQTLRFADWRETTQFIVPEKAGRLGETTGLLLVPLIIENTVLGSLSIFCHPDVLKQHETRANFYGAAWSQLALALAIAIQGELAMLDRLTGVVNQAYFLKRLAQEIERSNRYELSLGVLMVDIDNFKAVNDTLGHPQGDAMLRIVSKLIKKEARVVDLVGRYGGEEFIVLLPETGFSDEHEGVSGAVTVAERIRKSVEDEFRDLQKPLAITVSVGVAVRRYPQDRQTDAREVVRIADEQLYKAKTTGKNRCCVYTPEAPERVA